MKLIIDIDKDVRDAISQMGLLRIPNEMQKKVDRAIQHGIPLLEHHDDMECDTCQFDGMCPSNVRLLVKHNGCPKWTPKQTTTEEGDGE